MTTKLDGILKRELSIGGEPYTLTLSQQGFTLTLKGRRKGLDIQWAELVAGDAALATALTASLTANIVPRSKSAESIPRAETAKPGPRAQAPTPKPPAKAAQTKRRRSRP